MGTGVSAMTLAPHATPCTSTEQRADLAKQFYAPGPAITSHRWGCIVALMQDQDFAITHEAWGTKTLIGKTDERRKKGLGTHFFLLEKFWYSLWHSCHRLYEILSLFTLDRLVQINIMKIFLFPLYFHVPLFLSQNELQFEDIPIKTYVIVEYKSSMTFLLTETLSGVKNVDQNITVVSMTLCLMLAHDAYRARSLTHVSETRTPYPSKHLRHSNPAFAGLEGFWKIIIFFFLSRAY